MEWIQRFINGLKSFGLEQYGRYYGTYRGEVYDSNDPERKGRIKLLCPYVYGQDVYEYWAEPKAQYSGKSKCFYAAVEKGDKVWITFEAGDPTKPIWEFGQFEKDLFVEEAKENYTNNVTLALDDMIIKLDNTSKKITIKHKSGKQIELTETTISLGSQNKSQQYAIMGEDAVKLFENLAEITKNHHELLSEALNILLKYSISQEIVTANPPLTPLSAAYKTLSTQLPNKLVEIQQDIIAVEKFISEASKSLSNVVTLDKD